MQPSGLPVRFQQLPVEAPPGRVVDRHEAGELVVAGDHVDTEAGALHLPRLGMCVQPGHRRRSVERVERRSTPRRGHRELLEIRSAEQLFLQFALEQRAGEFQAVLRAERLSAPAVVSEAMGASVAALVAVIAELNAQISRLEGQLTEGFDQHPDAKIVRSLPGLGTILGARVLAEFGDDPNRYADAKARKNYAGTSPITKASGKSRVVLARYARNRRLSDACYLWAFAALTASPGARAFYDARRADGDTHNRALRALANRLVGLLHGCLRHHALYDEHTAWAHRQQEAA